MNPVTVRDLRIKKEEKRPIIMLTAFDYPIAGILDEAGVDVILVGDSLGMVALGYPTTLPVTMDEMIHHTKAVKRGVSRALLIGDMPFMSYQISTEQALANAGRFIKDGGAAAVKLEGAGPAVETVAALTAVGIPVMGHLGLTPQFVHQMGGFRVQGREESAAAKLKADALELEEAGAFAVVLECLPTELAAEITGRLTIPTIGIGAGPHCDGQVLVTSDLLGIYRDRSPRFAKRYAELGPQALKAVEEFVSEVLSGEFPGEEHSFD